MMDPSDDITLSEACVMMNELFVSLLAGGFTESQALRIVAHMIADSTKEKDEEG